MYSHPATRQDEWVLEVFNNRDYGTALEVGAYDGVKNSNTKQLELVGWDCTLIEAVPEFYKAAVKNRPNARCIQAVVSGRMAWAVPATMYVNGEWSGLIHTMPISSVKGHSKRKSKKLSVKMRSLTSLIKRKHFNYISLDTEGNEVEILEDWFAAGRTCDALTVEFNYDQDKYYSLLHLCKQYGMSLERVQGWDMFFLREGFK